MQVVFGVYNMSETEAKAFVEIANAAGAGIENYECKFSKLGIEKYLEENPDTDVAILSESLETKSAYEVSDFERLVDLHEDLKIIPILNENTLGSEKIRGIFNLGIYTGVYAKDATGEMVARLIVDGRQRKAAKVYYQIKDNDNELNAANIPQCVDFIENGNQEEIGERADYIRKHVEPADFIKIKNNLSDGIRKVVEETLESDQLNFSAEANTEEKEQKNVSVPAPQIIKGLSVLGGLFKKSQKVLKNQFSRDLDEDNNISGIYNSMEKEISPELKEVLANVQIGFVGTQRRIGTTHQAIIAAHYLAAKEYRVALVDCSYTKGKSFHAISKYKDVENHGKYFTYGEVDYYPDLQKMDDVLSSKRKYNFIVIDYGVYAKQVRDDISRCVLKCAVAGTMPWEIGQLNSFSKEVRATKCDFEYLIRGVPEMERENTLWLAEISDKCYFADVQENPFNGEAYLAIRKILRTYVSEGSIDEKKFMPKYHIKSNSKVGAPLRNVEAKPQVVGMATCFVTSLKHGCGATHFSVSLANYIMRDGMLAGLVTDKPDAVEGIFDYEIDIVKRGCNYESLYSDNDYIVMDAGVMNQLSGKDLEELKRSTYRIMMCWADDEYLEKLAAFIESQNEGAENWIYVFNNVPEKRIGEISKLMNQYFSCFLPVYDNTELTKSVKKIMKEILHK